MSRAFLLPTGWRALALPGHRPRHPLTLTATPLALLYAPLPIASCRSDVNEELRKRCYGSKCGPHNTHIVFYYNYGTNAFGERDPCRAGRQAGRA